MLLTLLLSFVLMAALFLMILVAVALIKEKRLFITGPKDIQEATLDHDEPFPGARAIGWVLLCLILLLIPGAFVYGGWDGIRQGYGFWQFFGRFGLMLLLWKVYDIVFLDWFLITRSHFFQHFFPETEGCAGYHQFGFNRKGQLKQIVAFPFAALLMAWVCTLL